MSVSYTHPGRKSTGLIKNKQIIHKARPPFTDRLQSRPSSLCRIPAPPEAGQLSHDQYQTELHQVNERLERGFTQEEKAQFTAFLLRAGRNLTDEEEEA